MDKKIKILIAVVVIAFVGIVIWALFPEKEILQGEIEAKTVNVSSKIPGRITKLAVEKGQFVRKGDVLAELDTPELSAKQEQILAKIDAASAVQEKVYNGSRQEAVLAAKSKMEEAKAGYEISKKTDLRLQNLFKEGVISAQKADESKARLQASYNLYLAAKSTYEMLANGNRYEDKEVARASVNQAKGALKEIDSYLKENKLIAPIDGEVSEISAEEGELAGTGYPIVVLSDSSKMWATFNVRETLLSKLKQGSEIKADIPALDLKNVKMKISLIAVRGNYATYKATRAKGEYDIKTFEVRAVPVEKIDGLKPGMSVILKM
ncbi:MAG: HlyD family secretion protein [Candidatus Gastranaerophilaceae bacterium]